MTTTTEITFSPREKAPQGTRVTSWWIDGSRDRYGLAYFISNRTVFRRDGAVEEQIILMENHRPYGVNLGRIVRSRPARLCAGRGLLERSRRIVQGGEPVAAWLAEAHHSPGWWATGIQTEGGAMTTYGIGDRVRLPGKAGYEGAKGPLRGALRGGEGWVRGRSWTSGVAGLRTAYSARRLLPPVDGRMGIRAKQKEDEA